MTDGLFKIEDLVPATPRPPDPERPLTLDDLRRLSDAATPGPWNVCGCKRCHQVWSHEADCLVANAWMRDDGSGAHVPMKQVAAERWLEDEDQMQANAELIAAAVNDLRKRLGVDPPPEPCGGRP